MIRELDTVTLTFSLWEESRRELLRLEERLIAMRRAPAVDPQELDILDAEIAVLRVKTERLLGQAIEALRELRQAQPKGPG